MTLVEIDYGSHNALASQRTLHPRTALWGRLLKGWEELISLSWDWHSPLCGTRESTTAKQLGLKPEAESNERATIQRGRETRSSVSTLCFQDTGETHQLTAITVESRIPETVRCRAATDQCIFREGLRRTGPVQVRGHLPKFQHYLSLMTNSTPYTGVTHCLLI